VTDIRLKSMSRLVILRAPRSIVPEVEMPENAPHITIQRASLPDELPADEQDIVVVVVIGGSVRPPTVRPVPYDWYIER
jgi:hypothetical protein